MWITDSDIDAIVNDMKPWYDNYCFAKQALKKKTRMFNCDMVLYYLRNYMDGSDPTSYILSFSSQSVHLNLKEIIYS